MPFGNSATVGYVVIACAYFPGVSIERPCIYYGRDMRKRLCMCVIDLMSKGTLYEFIYKLIGRHTGTLRAEYSLWKQYDLEATNDYVEKRWVKPKRDVARILVWDLGDSEQIFPKCIPYSLQNSNRTTHHESS